MSADPPLGLLAELTHRCPLHCPYCSNPVELVRRERELTTDQWRSVFTQARALGVLQVHLSGGEPLARRDLPELAAHAAGLGCYVNLVTSGLGLTKERMTELAARGIDHVQLSVQAADRQRADAIAGTRAAAHKRSAAEAVRAVGLPLTVNVVLHRGNLDEVGAIIELAEELGADRLELANAQYYGWALRNRDSLMPTRGQLDAADTVVRAAKARLAGRMEVIHVIADYHDSYPKPCMHGWGARQLTVAPDGTVLPCPSAHVISTLTFDNATTRPLAEIWYESESFTAYRGEDWMRDPCRTCDRRGVDFGGCRCQAFLLTGAAENTDPVCPKSPHHGVVTGILADSASRQVLVGVAELGFRMRSEER
ncbi:pyrroloquinoline quinone biosynthesis protein PqqE [Actinokineospora auranticolor]|uniref:PqqA peptide cyclase n=1 Tax=Actinokineospora auranticolor TaxID=155976 RepID=A0A2S6GPV8_9PSEU|nr:pyrroloquinoline quinone biosynthesis protein PqqE [Actinokineospora auranticolor]PPK67203.1 pyrroloquinoline quinone biosynthesis protein E [Actinokineospora auranticolor]